MKSNDQESTSLPRAVFVLSPMPRCGTTLLSFVLVESGCCEWPPKDRILAEDFFLKHAQMIEDYCDKTSREWGYFTKDQQELDRLKNLLIAHIGQALLQFAGPQSFKAPIVLKTPHAENIDLLPRLFPESNVLFIVRDGRDAVESAARAFPRAGYEYWMGRWAIGVRDILQFMEKYEKNSQAVSWKLIRYEELISEGSPVVPEILQFFGNKSEFTWRDLQALPVYGSSYLGGKKGEFKWEVKSKPENFSSLGRWSLWDEDRKQKFKEIAGAELIRLQYAKDNRW